MRRHTLAAAALAAAVVSEPLLPPRSCRSRLRGPRRGRGCIAETSSALVMSRDIGTSRTHATVAGGGLRGAGLRG